MKTFLTLAALLASSQSLAHDVTEQVPLNEDTLFIKCLYAPAPMNDYIFDENDKYLRAVTLGKKRVYKADDGVFVMIIRSQETNKVIYTCHASKEGKFKVPFMKGNF